MNIKEKETLFNETSIDLKTIELRPDHLIDKYRLLSDSDKKEVIFMINLSIMLSEKYNSNEENNIIQFPSCLAESKQTEYQNRSNKCRKDVLSIRGNCDDER